MEVEEKTQHHRRFRKTWEGGRERSPRLKLAQLRAHMHLPEKEGVNFTVNFVDLEMVCQGA